MDYNQKKAKAREEILAWINKRDTNNYAEEYKNKENERIRKIAKQFGLTVCANELGL